MASEVQACEPLKMLILPKGISSNARICTLAHPRTSKQSRYYFCPDRGTFEFTRIAAPKSSCHSWLLAQQNRHDNPVADLENEKPPTQPDHANEIQGGGNNGLSEVDGAQGYKSISLGYIVKTPEFFVATPIDPLFLLLRSLQSKKLFLSADDIFDDLCESSKHFREISNNDRMRGSLEERLNAVCDVVEAGDEKMYRLSAQKLLNELLTKAKAMVVRGLPTSMEERFVHKALETPVMGLKREQSSQSDIVGTTQDEVSVSTPVPSEARDSQSSTTTSESAASDSSTQTTVSVPDQDRVSTVSGEIKHLLRIRTAFSYMISTYVPASLGTTLNRQLSSDDSPVNFKPLDVQLAQIAKMRSEVLASRSLSDFSRKRSMNEDDEAAETRAEKKRKKEEDEKRKKVGESRSIRDLKKVDTSSMKKMSDFFGKGVSKKK